MYWTNLRNSAYEKLRNNCCAMPKKKKFNKFRSEEPDAEMEWLSTNDGTQKPNVSQSRIKILKADGRDERQSNGIKVGKDT